MAKLLLGKEVTDALNAKLQERTAALIMLVVEDRAANDGQGSVAPDKIVGEGINEVKELVGRRGVDLHRGMRA